MKITEIRWEDGKKYKVTNEENFVYEVSAYDLFRYNNSVKGVDIVDDYELKLLLELEFEEVIETVDFKTAYDDCKANGTEYKATYKGKTDIMSIGALSDGTESVSIESEDGSCFRGLYLLDEWTKA